MNYTKILLQKLKKSLLNTKKILGENIIQLINNNKNINISLLENIKNQLLLADINIHTTQKIIYNLKNQIKNNNNCDTKSIYNILRNEMLKITTFIEKPLSIKKEKKPFIILTIGVNGSGKTTTIGKLAYHYKQQNKTVILAAGDTHRISAIDQLKILGKRSKCDLVVASHIHTDPASIIFDAIQIAKSKSVDLLIIDTAGRLQNNKKSIEELKKIIQVIKKIEKEAPHETILIIDANIGQNSIHQVQIFNEKINVTGIIVTKLDGSAKGGVLLSIADRFKIPIPYIGIGQNLEDLQKFKSQHFIDAIWQNNH